MTYDQKKSLVPDENTKESEFEQTKNGFAVYLTKGKKKNQKLEDAAFGVPSLTTL